MYRRTEYQLLDFLGWLSLICIVGSLIFLILFMVQSLEPYRILALILMILGLVFKLQVFMYKLNVIERRMLHLVDLGEQHFIVAEKRSLVQLVLFYILFWIAFIGVSLAFIL